MTKRILRRYKRQWLIDLVTHRQCRGRDTGWYITWHSIRDGRWDNWRHTRECKVWTTNPHADWDVRKCGNLETSKRRPGFWSKRWLLSLRWRPRHSFTSCLTRLQMRGHETLRHTGCCVGGRTIRHPNRRASRSGGLDTSRHFGRCGGQDTG